MTDEEIAIKKARIGGIIEALQGVPKYGYGGKKLQVETSDRIRPIPEEPGFCGTRDEVIDFYENKLKELEEK